MNETFDELARLGTATVHEAAAPLARSSTLDLIQVVPGSRAAGPARTVRCGQDDNLMVHAAIAEAQPGEVLVLTMPEPTPIALDRRAARDAGEGARRRGDPRRRRGARRRGARASSACRSGRATSASAAPSKDVVGRRSASRSRSAARRSARATSSCSTPTAPSSSSRSGSTRCSPPRASGPSARREKRAKLQAGALSYDLDGLRQRVEAMTRADARPRADRPRRAADPEARGEPALLRRRARDGGGGARGAVRLPARLGRLPPLQPEADRVAAGRARPHGAPRLEPRGARAARRRDRGRPAAASAGSTATSATAPPTASPIPTATSSSSTTRPSATRRPST